MNGISARLDRLPITPIHRAAFVALAFAYFFELGDLNTFAYAAPAMIKAWGIDVSVVATITSASFAGMFFGAMVGGALANRIGRKPAFVMSTLVYSVFSLLNALAWDVPSLMVLRLATGVGLSSMTVIANTYIGEFFPARVRGRYMGLTMTVGLVGIPATAWVARAVVPMAPWGWRLIFVWGALGMVAAMLAARMVESPRWLSVHGRDEEAEAILGRLERSVRGDAAPVGDRAGWPEQPAAGADGRSCIRAASGGLHNPAAGTVPGAHGAGVHDQHHQHAGFLRLHGVGADVAVPAWVLGD